MEEYHNKIAFKQNDICWMIEYRDKETKFAGFYIGLNILQSFCHNKLFCSIKDNNMTIFKLFDDFSRGTLDDEYIIIFPQQDDQITIISVTKKDVNIMNERCTTRYLDNTEGKLLELAYAHIMSIKSLLYKISTLEDNFAMLSSFMDVSPEKMKMIKAIMEDKSI